jgi:catechol 2,3-dioxygenase
MVTIHQSGGRRYFQPRRLGHVNLWVDDISNSERFYNACCGLTVEFTEPDLIASFLGTGATPHDLGMIQKTNGVDRYGRNGLLQLPGTIGLHAGLNHLAWELENEAALVDAFRRLKSDGIATDITVDHQVAHSVYLFDPDGNYNEFYCDTVKDWRRVLRGPMDLLTSHWDPLACTPSTDGRYDNDPLWDVVEAAPLHPKRITHAVLETPDLPRLRDFYTGIAGLAVVADQAGACFLGGSLDKKYAWNLVLVPADQPAYHHASFELIDEPALEASLRGLRDAGVAVAAETNLPWKRSFFLRDPDGLLSEWYVYRPAPRRLEARGSVSLAHAV